MRSFSMNFCDLPPWVIGSVHFNQKPQPLEIQGVRRSNRQLFERLAALDAPEARGEQFHDYMDVKFQLHQWEQEASARSRKSLKNSYLRFLRGWMFDSNAVEGAVLKGWVESRIGLAPTFHREPIPDIHCEAYYRYTTERMKGTIRTNAINDQLDVLFAFAQEELQRRHPGVSHLTLWRGINDFDEHEVLEEYDRHRYRLQLNNLNSFTNDFERAWEFGSKVLEVEVPLVKVFFCGDLLPRSLLRGEGELMVIGGEFDVTVRIGG
jgi:NAD+--dinitrogen-reductase ADP-D-ribosyltransferase